MACWGPCRKSLMVLLRGFVAACLVLCLVFVLALGLHLAPVFGYRWFVAGLVVLALILQIFSFIALIVPFGKEIHQGFYICWSLLVAAGLLVTLCMFTNIWKEMDSSCNSEAMSEAGWKCGGFRAMTGAFIALCGLVAALLESSCNCLMGDWYQQDE